VNIYNLLNLLLKEIKKNNDLKEKLLLEAK